jgi:Ser/Thr protein kinase RdoA (MazF antagonist)
MPVLENAAFMQQIDGAIRQFCKQVEDITFIEPSGDNIVVVANRQYVFRFPRNADSAKRLSFETALLQKIGKQLPGVHIPGLVQVHTQPFYVVANYIEGDHLTDEQVRGLSPDAQMAIGQKIATFSAQLNAAISGLELRRLRTEAGVDGLEEPWEPYFERLFVRESLPNNLLRPIIDQHYMLWRDYSKQEQSTFAIHDDLHPRNLLFLGQELHGVVDFGDANTGSIEEEFRWLYGMG